MKRGTIKAFREYLNRKFADSDKWKHEGFGQRVNKYGDYLYRQDRAKFDVELADALAGREHTDFVAEADRGTKSG